MPIAGELMLSRQRELRRTWFEKGLVKALFKGIIKLVEELHVEKKPIGSFFLTAVK